MKIFEAILTLSDALRRQDYEPDCVKMGHDTYHQMLAEFTDGVPTINKKPDGLVEMEGYTIERVPDMQLGEIIVYQQEYPRVTARQVVIQGGMS